MTSDSRRSNLAVVRSEDAKSDAEIGEKMKKKSSLTSLRKDNEVKLEEIKLVCNNNDRESVVKLCGLQFQGNE